MDRTTATIQPNSHELPGQLATQGPDHFPYERPQASPGSAVRPGIDRMAKGIVGIQTKSVIVETLRKAYKMPEGGTSSLPEPREKENRVPIDVATWISRNCLH